MHLVLNPLADNKLPVRSALWPDLALPRLGLCQEMGPVCSAPGKGSRVAKLQIPGTFPIKYYLESSGQ